VHAWRQDCLRDWLYVMREAETVIVIENDCVIGDGHAAGDVVRRLAVTGIDSDFSTASEIDCEYAILASFVPSPTYMN
jgi:hypothetical protein